MKNCRIQGRLAIFLRNLIVRDFCIFFFSLSFALWSNGIFQLSDEEMCVIAAERRRAERSYVIEISQEERSLKNNMWVENHEICRDLADSRMRIYGAAQNVHTRLITRSNVRRGRKVDHVLICKSSLSVGISTSYPTATAAFDSHISQSAG